MPVSIELQFPPTEELFEEMCFNLYKSEWKNLSCNRLGGPGQSQFGLDIMGHYNGQDIGVQCKHYLKKEFTLGVIEKDLEKVDDKGFVIDHVIFATSAANKAELVRSVKTLSAARRKAGKCTVSVDFWAELSALLRKHKEVAREYIPGFPGGTLLEVRDTGLATLAAMQAESVKDAAMRAWVTPSDFETPSPGFGGIRTRRGHCSFPEIRKRRLAST